MMHRKAEINAIYAATNEVFTTMLSDEPVPGAAYIERNAGGLADGVVSLIGLTGEWIGTGLVTCSAALACKLSALLLMTEHVESDEAVNEEVLDSMAEITNMVIGNVKNILEAELGELHLSIPTVVYGKNLTTRSVNDGEWVVVPFECQGDRLSVKLCLVPNTAHRTTRASFALSEAR